MYENSYLVIIGDIIKSRNITNRERFQEHFESQLNQHEIFGGENIISPFTVTIGDEFQGVLKNSGSFFNSINTFEYRLNFQDRIGIKSNTFNLRYGIGIGEITTKINKNSAIGMDGPAFYHARESLEIAKKQNLKYCFKSKTQKDEVINLMLRWLGHETRKWSFQKFQIIKLKRDGLTQKQISESLKISQPAVSKALQSVPLMLSVKTENIIEQEINYILEEMNIGYGKAAEATPKYNSKKLNQV